MKLGDDPIVAWHFPSPAVVTFLTFSIAQRPSRPVDAVLSIGAYQVPVPLKKRRFLLIWATSHPHYKEQPFPITGLRCAALSIYGLGHSTTQMTLQLLRWKRYKAEKGPIHLSSTRKCSTRSTSDPRANSGTRKRGAEKDCFQKKQSEDFWEETAWISADRFSQTLFFVGAH